jgi:hypothetical protein
MAKLLTVPVVDDSEQIAASDVEVLIVELVGDEFEDTVITDSGRVLYVSAGVDDKRIES